MNIIPTIEPVYYLLPLLGFVVGIFGTMLGGGGGFIFMSFYILVCKMPAHMAIINTLIVTIPVCVFGFWEHLRNRNVNLKIGIYFSIFGILGTIPGIFITGIISAGLLKIVFGIYAVLISTKIFIFTLIKSNRLVLGFCSYNSYSEKFIKLKSGFFAIFAGIITGTFGTSGVAPVITGLLNLELPVKTVIGTSLFIVLANTLFASGLHLIFSGGIDLTLAVLVSIGSIPGSILGAKILNNSKIEKHEYAAKYIYAVVFIVLGFIMIAGEK